MAWHLLCCSWRVSASLATFPFAMKKIPKPAPLRPSAASALAALALFAFASPAQMPIADEQARLLAREGEILAPLKNAALRKLVGAQPKTGVGRYNALRVADDLKDATPDAALAWYAVPPMSGIQRLADQFPVDGRLNAPLRLVACRDEFEPASFVVYPFADAAKLQVGAGDLRSDGGGVLPAAQVDVKVVKIWYQNGNGWYNYFGDVGLKLVPELLLNDETLVRVDTEKRANYLRVNYPEGDREIWISAPAAIDPGFSKEGEPVNDAATLQPVALRAGEFKQFFVTVHVPKDTAPGLYKGTLALTADGKAAGSIPVRLRVLPHVLPKPKTYYDLDADFYTMLYCVDGPAGAYLGNGRDRAAARAKLRRRLQNQVDHNVRYPLYFGLWRGYEGLGDVEDAIAIAKEVGMELDPFFEAFSCVGTGKAADYCDKRRKAMIAQKEFKRILGHGNLYPAGGEEPGYGTVVKSRRNWRAVHELGMHVLCNGWDRRHFSGYNDDFRVGGGGATLDQALFMHRVKGKIGNYANPHTGPENPDFMRRAHGLNLYKKEYDMMYNYGYQDGGWNDLVGFYRNMNLVYATKDGYIDTLAWEGVREGIDDIRYATLLRQLAEKALAVQGDVDADYTARKGLQFLALFNEETDGLDAFRAEAIRHINAISAILEKHRK